MKVRRTRKCLLWISTAMLFASCQQATNGAGGGTPVPQASATSSPQGILEELDACDLLTQSEVSAATGYQLGAPPDSRTQSQCPWPSTDPEKPSKRVLLEASLTDQAGDDLISAYQSNMSSAGRSVTPASGIGDKALVVTGEDTGPFAEVYAVKNISGQTAVLRLIIGGDADEPFDTGGMTDAAKSLVTTAVSRLS